MIEFVWIPFFILITAILGLQFRFLTPSGSVAAFLVGLVISYGLGIKGLLLLGVFFATSSLWSIYRRKEKSIVEERHAKGSQRDYQQVLANGGMAAVASLLYGILREPSILIAFCVFIASSNSDTWASEIGSLSKKRPYSVRTFTVVEHGTSGAISALGTFASLIGALVIAVVSVYLFQLGAYELYLIFLLGFAGNVIDTFLGAYFQASYICPVCGIETEKLAHCGNKTTLVKGKPFLNNDFVNFVSSFIPAIIILFLY